MSLGATQKVIVRLVDTQGKTGTTSFRITADGSTDPSSALAGYLTPLRGITDCAVLDGVGQTSDGTPDGTAVTNPYNNRDKLRVILQGINNDRHVIDCPDPDPTIFDPTDYKKVDPTSSVWTALKGILDGNMVDRLGNALVVVRAFRQMSRHLKSSRRA